jgi:GAF domain-containing protein
MRFKAWRGLSDSYRRAVEGHTPWLQNAKCAEPIIVADVQQDAGLAAFLPTIRAENIAAMAFIPLEGVDGVLGKFMLYYGKPHRLSSEELQLASVVAAQIAFAVERTQAYQASRTSQERQNEAELARVQALEQSTRASQRLAAIVQSSDDAIVSKDLNGVIMSWNPAAERMFGYSESEAVGQSITLILPADRRAEVRTRFSSLSPVRSPAASFVRPFASSMFSPMVAPVIA